MSLVDTAHGNVSREAVEMGRAAGHAAGLGGNIRRGQTGCIHVVRGVCHRGLLVRRSSANAGPAGKARSAKRKPKAENKTKEAKGRKQNRNK